jgi:phosphomannomutase
MISVSGVRGVIPTGLDIDKVVLFIRAFSDTLSGNTVVIGRDSRPSGQFIENIVKGVFLSVGKNIISLGVTSTPTVKAVVNATKSAGGVMISASHNPLEWNAFKFIGKGGFFIQEDQINQVLSIIRESRFTTTMYAPQTSILEGSQYSDIHLHSVIDTIDLRKVKKRKFHVLVDAVNGGGSYIVPELLERLGCVVTKLNCLPDGKFPRPPEPTPEALKKASKLMKSSNFDIGFALDPDADRLVVLTPNRGAISEEYTVPLTLLSILEKNNTSKNIVINLSSSFITETLAKQYKKNVIRSKVGEANVVSEMLRSKAFFGGEGNGGVIDPAVPSFGRDSLVGIANILNLIAIQKTSIDSIVDTLPEIHISKSVLPLKGGLQNLIDKLKSVYQDATIDEQDGVRFDFGSSWVHLRASNTEPILRVIAEAETKKEMKLLLDNLRSAML